LVVGPLTGGATGVFFSYILAPYRPRLVPDGHAIRPLIRYGRWVFLTALVAVSANSLTQIVISRQLGAFELGIYFLASKLAIAPREFATQVTNDVAFPLFARIQSDRILVAKVLGLVGLVGSFGNSASFFFEDWAIRSGWQSSSPCSQVSLLRCCGP
jgi:O-antigen/teichoic acid export membrane protein